MNVYGVILAGGGGTRFWPLSRQDLPKQFLNLTGTELLVNETIDRLNGIVEQDHLFIVTSRNQVELAHNLTNGRVREDHVLSEPMARNTAACIGYAAMEIIRKYGDGIMCIFPSDHYIKNEELFQLTLRAAIHAAEETDYLVTIGIKPSFAATGYGYIRSEKTKDGKPYAKVAEFVEKPDLKKAKEYLAKGNYLWNSGMFIWKASVILEEFEALLPGIYANLKEIGDSMNTEREQSVIDRIYPEIARISIDYGIMERSKRVIVFPGNFEWSDVGSWDALQALHEGDENGNVLYGEQIHIDTHNCISYAKTKLIAALGVEDLIIVEADDAILVCRRDMAQDVRRVVEQLKTEGKNQYL